MASDRLAACSGHIGGATPVPGMTAPARDIARYFNLTRAYGSVPKGDSVSGALLAFSNGLRLTCDGQPYRAPDHLGLW
jgi:hypothetical protein